jgi:hypothetical protein
MKYLNVLVLLFFYQVSIAQNCDYIKKLDTIYISFKKSKFNIKMDYPEEKNGFKNKSFIFNYKKHDENTFQFEFDRNKVVENKEVNKAFLKKNKAKIITIKALKRIEYQDVACNIFNRLKIIYIIDLTEKKHNNVMLYRVISTNLCYVKE